MFDDSIVSYVVNSMRPFSSVSDKWFINMFKVANPDLKVMSRSTLMRRIQSRRDLDHKETVAELAKSEYISTMADIWSSKHHSYLGVSATWLDDDLKRHFRVLACSPFDNPHTAEAIGEKLHTIHEKHGAVIEKLVTSCTDSAANMLKGFRVFGVQVKPLEDQESQEESTCDVVDLDEYDDEDEEADYEAEAAKLMQEIEAYEEVEEEVASGVYLPKHQR